MPCPYKRGFVDETFSSRSRLTHRRNALLQSAFNLGFFMKPFSLALLASALLSFSASAQVAPTPAPVPTVTPTPAPTPSSTPVPSSTPPVQDPRRDDTPVQTAPQVAATPAPSPTPTPTPAPKTIDDLTKGFDKSEGVFTLYRKVENNRQRLLAEIKESQIGPLFVLQSTYATGNGERITAGRPARDLVWRWKRTPDDRLIVAVPNLWFRATDPNLKTAVERDFPDAYLDVFPILASNKERKTVLIDFASFFDGSITGLNTALEPNGPLRGVVDAYVLDPELSFVERLRSFPTNLVVEANYHFKRVARGQGESSETQADPRSLPVKVVFNVYDLPQTNYRPRLADPRVGYFINGQLSARRTGFETFDDDSRADPRVVYINRWNVQKSQPNAALSAPIKPIRFYLDTTVPRRYRRVMREGILGWNAAFERIGIKGAIEVLDAPVGKDAEYDHADMRFNTLRWVASPPTNSGAYAVALLRENPLTGEILNASVTVNANFARLAFQEKQEIVDPLDASSTKHAHEGDEHFVCEWPMQIVDPRFTDEKYVDDLLRALVAHEFGHILGLRHNFLGSTFHSPQSLANPIKVKREGVSASVMDYVGFNVFGLKTGAPLFMQGPGVYDNWAIEYGYKPLSSNERAGLKAIAARSDEPGLAYYGDEVADNYDPTVVRYDLSSDPLTYAQTSFATTRELLRTLGNRHPKSGESYFQFTRRLRGLIRGKGRDAAIAARFVGGSRVRRVVNDGNKSQGRAPFSPVPASQQKRALELLNQEIFAAKAWAIPQGYLSQTAPDPYDFDDPAADAAFPIRDDVARLRANILNGMFASTRLSRLSNAEWKFPGQTLSLREMFPTVRRGVWGELRSSTKYSALERELAREHLKILTDLATDKRPDAPGDARLIATAELRSLQSALSAPRKSSPDSLTRLFFADALRRIDAALQKKPV